MHYRFLTNLSTIRQFIDNRKNILKYSLIKYILMEDNTRPYSRFISSSNYRN